MINKILVVLKEDAIIFSLYRKDIKDDNINNTDIINMENLKFTEDYILDNYELVSSFFNLVIIKKNITIAYINNLEIAETTLKVLKKIKNISTVIFKENKKLNYTLSSYLLDNIYLNRIECYSMPEMMFNRFPNDIVNTREKILCNSDFIDYNNIKTYSQLCNKDKILIDSNLTYNDVDDIIYFFKTNNNLKKIYIKGYNRNNLLAFLKMLKENNFKKVKIILIDNIKVNKNIIEDSKLFNKINKKYNVTIKIKYSNQYKEKNKVKELTLKMCKIFLIIIILILIWLFIFSMIKEKKIENKINDDLKIINEIISENTNNNVTEASVVDNNNQQEEDLEEQSKEKYISPYYTNYENVYTDLLEINNDTVGWLKINNTKINYPVVQYKDNEYYLNHSFDKTKNEAGWVFVDYRNNMNIIDKNIIVYAHNVSKNELMFGSLKNTLNSDWNSDTNNLTFLFNIKGINYYYEIFSIYTIKNTNDYLVTEFDDYSFMKYINMIKNRSIKDFNINVDEHDSIITLSTCYKESDYRLVVHAKRK